MPETITLSETRQALGRCIRSGAVAGAISAAVFALVHDLMISDIWSSIWMLMAAGAICGAGLGWTYGLLFEAPSVGSWIRYNLIYLILFVVLAVVSLLVFEPITTAAEVLASDEPPNDLFAEALPVSAAFTLAAAALIGWRYGRAWTDYLAVLLTCAVLVLLLGLNVAIIGLVEVPSSAVHLIVEMFFLIVALNAVFAGAYVALERNRFFSAQR